MTLDPKLEQLLHNSQKDNNSLAITIEPKLAESIFNSIQTAVNKVEEEKLCCVGCITKFKIMVVKNDEK